MLRVNAAHSRDQRLGTTLDTTAKKERFARSTLFLFSVVKTLCSSCKNKLKQMMSSTTGSVTVFSGRLRYVLQSVGFLSCFSGENQKAVALYTQRKTLCPISLQKTKVSS